jgi:hypothetical protein
MTTDLKKRENGIVIFERFPSFNCPEPVLVNINQFVSKNVGQKPAGFVLPEGYLKGKWLRLIRVVVVLVGPRRAKPGAPAKKTIILPRQARDKHRGKLKKRCRFSHLLWA